MNLKLKHLFIAGSVITILGIIIVLIFYKPENGNYVTLQLEILKSLFQILVVIILGGLVSVLLKNEERTREQSKVRIETWKDYLKRIGHLYRNVKRARRCLTSGGLSTRYEAPSTLSKIHAKLYIEQMKVINEAQLELEGMKIEAENLPDFLSVNYIPQYLERAEDYLRQIVKEFEETLSDLELEKNIKFASLERLNEFTTITDEPFIYKKSKKKTDYRFGTHFADSFREISKTFNKAFKY